MYILNMYCCFVSYVVLSSCPCLSSPPYALSLFMQSRHIQILICHFPTNLFRHFCTQIFSPIYFDLFAQKIFPPIYFDLFAQSQSEVSSCHIFSPQGRLLEWNYFSHFLYLRMCVSLNLRTCTG